MKNKFQVSLSYESIFNISLVCFQGKDKGFFFLVQSFQIMASTLFMIVLKISKYFHKVFVCLEGQCIFDQKFLPGDQPWPPTPRRSRFI